MWQNEEQHLRSTNQVIRVCEEYEKHLKQAGQDCRAGQPTPGNKAGGLSTLDEKSLGCIRKGGTRPIVEVLEQAVRRANMVPLLWIQQDMTSLLLHPW